jgi:hypothetical protein
VGSAGDGVDSAWAVCTIDGAAIRMAKRLKRGILFWASIGRN